MTALACFELHPGGMVREGHQRRTIACRKALTGTGRDAGVQWDSRISTAGDRWETRGVERLPGS